MFICPRIACVRRAPQPRSSVRLVDPRLLDGLEDLLAAADTAAEAGDTDDSGETSPAKAALTQRPWPTGLTEQIKAVAEVLSSAGRSLDLDGVAAHFNGRGRWRDRLPTLLDTLTALGRTRLVEGRWVSAGV